MAATQLNGANAEVLVGAGTTVQGSAVAALATNYYVTSIKDGDFEVNNGRVLDSDGLQVVELIYQRQELVSLELIPKSGVTPSTDFPKGLACTLTGLTLYIVDSFTWDKKAEPHTVSVTLRKPGFTLS